MNNKRTDLQFTELTQDDIDTHEDLYIELLISNGLITCDKKYKEALKSKKLFQKTFG